MSATPPEANRKYSRGQGPSEGAPARPTRATRSRQARPGGGSRSGDLAPTGVLAGGLLGAILLFVAEFTTLYSVHLTGRAATISSEAAGTHHAYALVPIAALAALLALGLFRGAGRAALLALVAVGVIGLLIALLGDLPDARAQGLTHNFILANASPGTGMYLETLGAMVLILAGGLGLAMTPPADRAAGGRKPGAR